MAISLRTDVNSATSSGSSQATGITLDAISDGATDDHIVVMGGWSDNNGTWDAISGFTEDVDHQTGTGDDRSIGIQYKKHTGSEGANYLLTGTDVSGSGQSMSGLICAFDGVDTSTPLDTTTQVAIVSNDTTPTSPAITTITNGAWVVVALIMSDGDVTAFGAPTGYTLIGEVINGTGIGDGSNIALAYKEVSTAGTETPGAWTATGSTSTNDSTVITFAIRPESVGGGDQKFLTLLGVG